MIELNAFPTPETDDDLVIRLQQEIDDYRVLVKNHGPHSKHGKFYRRMAQERERQITVYADMIGRAYQDERHPSAEEAFAELLQIYRYHRYEEVLISELIVNILEYAYELGDPELSLEDNLEIALIQFEAMFPV